MRRQTVERETPRVRPASSTVTIAPATRQSYHSRLTVSTVSYERPRASEGGVPARADCSPRTFDLQLARVCFGAIQDARAICHVLFGWYNDAHHHGGLRYLTPADVHYGRAAAILDVRYQTHLAAYAAHSQRFVQGPPRRETLPEAVWINAPTQPARQDAPGTTIVTPADPQHGGIERPNVLVEDRSIVIANSVAALH
jgi:hypothetical protein